MVHGGLVSIYLLQLQNGAVYVGKTSNPQQREAEHCDPNNHHVAWVSRHGPPLGHLLVQEEVPEEHSSGAEDRLTAKQMWHLGVNKVRGGMKTCARDYTLDDLYELKSYIGHQLNKDFAEVEQRLRSQLTHTSPRSPAAGRRRDYAAPRRLEGGGARFHPYAPQSVERCVTCRAPKSNGPDKPKCYECWKAAQQESSGGSDEEDVEDEDEEESFGEESDDGDEFEEFDDDDEFDDAY
jgi:hypothetical protein